MRYKTIVFYKINLICNTCAVGGNVCQRIYIWCMNISFFTQDALPISVHAHHSTSTLRALRCSPRVAIPSVLCVRTSVLVPTSATIRCVRHPLLAISCYLGSPKPFFFLPSFILRFINFTSDFQTFHPSLLPLLPFVLIFLHYLPSILRSASLFIPFASFVSSSSSFRPYFSSCPPGLPSQPPPRTPFIIASRYIRVTVPSTAQLSVVESLFYVRWTVSAHRSVSICALRQGHVPSLHLSRFRLRFSASSRVYLVASVRWYPLRVAFHAVSLYRIVYIGFPLPCVVFQCLLAPIHMVPLGQKSMKRNTCARCPFFPHLTILLQMLRLFVCINQFFYVHDTYFR